MTPTNDVDWTTLRREARAASARAYAPYSHVHVGAAALTADGRLVRGANVENASYGLTLCAECSLVSDFVGGGGGRLIAIAVVAGDGEPLTPCGRCRQLLFEHGGAGLVVDGGEGHDPLTIGELLPGAFGPSDLTARSS